VKTYAYCRVSTDRQQKSGLSLREQISQCIAYAEYRKFDLGPPRTITFDGEPCESRQRVVVEAESASKKEFLQRDGGAYLANHMTRGDQIIFPKLDRGFRNVKDLLAMLETWEIRGISAHFLDIRIDTASAVGKMLVTIMGAVAEMESARRSERVKDAVRTMRLNNFENTIKGDYAYHGFRFTATSKEDRRRRRMVPDETQRWKQDLFYEMYAQGWSDVRTRLYSLKKKITRSDGRQYLERDIREAVTIEHEFRLIEQELIARGHIPTYEETAELWLSRHRESARKRVALGGHMRTSREVRPPVLRQVPLTQPGPYSVPGLSRLTWGA
jgi:DNA invertase Pin-like site-specific DNA recombinase